MEGFFMAAISFGSLKQNLEAGRRELAKFKRILPYAPSSTRIQTQIIRHENSPRFQTIIPRLDKLSEKYDRLEDNFCLSSSWDSSADVIRDIKNNKVGNCGAMNDAMELMMLEDGLDAHAISLAITNKSDGGLKERVGDHLFAVLGLREDADFSDIKTWGNSAVIVDAWSNTVMAAREGMDYIKKLLGFDPALHNIEYEHSLTETERVVNRHFDKEFLKTFFEMSNPDYKLPDDVDFEKWIGDMQKNK